MTLYDVIFSYSHWRYLHHCCIFHRGGRNKEIISLHYRPTESLHFMQYDLDVRIWFSVNKFQKAWNEAEHYTSRGSQTCKSRTLEGNGRLYWESSVNTARADNAPSEPHKHEGRTINRNSLHIYSQFSILYSCLVYEVPVQHKYMYIQMNSKTGKDHEYMKLK